MRPTQVGSAASRGVNEWNQNWPRLYDCERRLHISIAKATDTRVPAPCDEGLHPCSSRMRGQLARPVPRGARASNGSRLLDTSILHPPYPRAAGQEIFQWSL